MLGWEGVIGLAEVMDAQAVVDEDPRMSAILQAGRDAGGVIEGHNPMLTGRELQAYITAGVNSDHTLASPSRYIEKLRLGVTVQLQERYMSREVIEAIKALPQPLPSLCLVTDDVAPDYLESYGHLDHVLKQVIELGLPPMQALQAATINPARRLRLFDRGAIVPGSRADLVLVDSLPSFNVSTTISGGEIVVENGQTLWRVPPNQPELDPLRNSLDLSPLSVEDFRINFPGDGSQAEVRVIISHPRGTTTEEGRAVVELKDGQPQIDETDLALIGVFARGEIGHSFGFIQGLGLQRGAIATTHAHDSHNLAVIGRDEQSMATAANAVIGMEGGMAVSVDNEVLARVPLPIAGIISDSPMPAVAHQLGRLTGVLADLGVKHPFLLMRLTTFTLPVSTGLRITDMGYVRAAERELVPLLIG